MECNIKPTTTTEEYILEDKDYLLIMAIRNLTATIERLRLSLLK